MSSDRHAHWDAAYVLGALSAAERQVRGPPDVVPLVPRRRRRAGRYAGAARPGADGRGARHGGARGGAGGCAATAIAHARAAAGAPALGQHVLVPAVAAAALVVGGLGGYALSEGRGRRPVRLR